MSLVAQKRQHLRGSVLGACTEQCDSFTALSHTLFNNWFLFLETESTSTRDDCQKGPDW